MLADSTFTLIDNASGLRESKKKKDPVLANSNEAEDPGFKIPLSNMPPPICTIECLSLSMFQIHRTIVLGTMIRVRPFAAKPQETSTVMTVAFIVIVETVVDAIVVVEAMQTLQTPSAGSWNTSHSEHK